MLTASTTGRSVGLLRRVRLPGLVLLLGLLATQAWAGQVPRPDPAKPDPGKTDPGKADSWRLRGLAFERKQAWAEACRCYEDVLRKERNNAIARNGYQRSLRRLHLARRHADVVYRQSLARLSPVQALEIYEQVLSILRVAYPDRTRTNLQQMFQQGLQELRLALDEPQFRRHHLPGVKPSVIDAYKKRLESWPARITTLSEAREQALLAIRSAMKDGFTLRGPLVSAFTLEFAAGACNTLDDFSSFLTPGSMATIQAALRGKLLGVGLELGIVEDQLAITRVYAKSPAAEAGLVKGDRVLKIGGQAVDDLPADSAAERLRGEAGSSVDVQIARVRKPIRLARRAFPISSVEYRQLDLDPNLGPHAVGYLRIHHFQDSTLQEVKDALAAMNNTGDPIKGLVLDLRGNPGGVFKSAVGVAELFLGGGVVAIGQSAFKDYNGPYKVDNPGPAQFPVVVLIDGETASAAEVLTAALKENRPRTQTLVLGQTTFGKGSIQCIIPMNKAPLEKLAGIRLTVARLLSPSSQPFSGRGISPDEVSDREGDALRDEAQARLQKLIAEVLGARPMIVVSEM